MRIKTGSGVIKHTLVSGSFHLRDGEEVFDGYITDISKQKQMEQQIRQLTESEADLQKQVELYRSTDIGGVFSVAMDENFTLLYGNDKYFKIHEYTKDSMREKLHNRCVEYIYPGDLPLVQKSVQTALDAGSHNVEWVMRIITGNGNIRHILCSGILETVGEMTIMNGMVIDMTKQKEMEEALRQSEEKFRIATENSDVTFWTYDFARKEMTQTQASQRIHGSGMIIPNVPQSLIDRGYVRSDSVEELLNLYRKLASGAKTASGEFWFQDLKKVGWWCEHIDYTTVFDNTGKPLCAYAIGKDVTPKKIAEQRYNEEVSYKNALISTHMIASMRIDLTTGNVEEVDSSYPEILADYAGKNYSQSITTLANLLINEEQSTHFLSAAQADVLLDAFQDGERQKDFRIQRKMPDGTYRWVSTIIIMTAYDWASIEKEARAAGVNLLISKPLFKSSLSSAFEKIYLDKNEKAPAIAQTEYDFPADGCCW